VKQLLENGLRLHHEIENPLPLRVWQDIRKFEAFFMR
jgi:hypothetical protein